MANNRSRIAMILPIEPEYSGRLVEGGLRYVREHPRITLVDLPYPVDSPDRLRLREPLGFDAAVIWASRGVGWVERLLERGVPLLAVSGDWPIEQVPCVAFDSPLVVEAAVEHLASLAPAAMCYLDFRIKELPIKEGRVRLFRAAAERHGIATSSAQLFDSDEQSGSEHARRLPLDERPARRLRRILGRLPKPAAVWCGEDHLARRVCEIAIESGLRVPEDVAVLGLGDFQAAQFGSPQLSSIPLPGDLVGYQAVATLDLLLSRGIRPKPFTPIAPPPVVLRESTCEAVTSEPIGRARTLVKAHCCAGLTVKQLAEGVGLSPQTLHVRFVKRYGRSPGEEIRQQRLATAKRFLQDPSISIARVAQMCGFNQQNRFSNFFRRETGMNPRTWRQRHES